MSVRMLAWLRHPWVETRVGLALGLLFVIAAWPKVVDPPGFAKALHAYHLLPGWAVFPVALALPWLEMLCGLALLAGLWKRAASTWIALMLLGFIGALSINLVRGRPVDCGCFSVGGSVRTDAERLREMKWTILRDLGMLAMALHGVSMGRPRAGSASGRPAGAPSETC